MIDQNIECLNNRPVNVRFKADANNFNNLPVSKPVYEEDIELPDMYYIPENYKKEQSVLDVIKKFDLFGIIKAWTEHPFLMVGTCAGMSLAIDAFDKSCNKEYEKSIVGKAAKLGDNIEQSKFVKNENSQKALKGIRKAWGKTKAIAMKNDVIYAMFTTPSQPEWNAPKDELKHTNYRLVHKFKELARLLDIAPKEGGGHEVIRRSFNIKDLALDKQEVEYLKKFYNVDKLSKAPNEEVVYRVMLQRIGKSEEEIANILTKDNVPERVAEELFKKSGLTREELDMIMLDETGETLELVKKASENLKGTKINNGRIVLPGSRQPFANVEGFENIYNRAHSLTDGAKTKTGRFMSKLVQKIHRGFTWGNQKTGVMLLVAPFLMETIVNTQKADKGEKVGTAVSGLINAISWVFTFPIALRMIYAFGGIQYAGMGKEKVETYRKWVNEFNEKTKLDNPKHFKSLAEYKDAKRKLKVKLKNLRKVDNQNLLTETLRSVSKFSKADLLKLESYKCGNMAQDTLRKLPNTLKDYLVYAPGRVLIFMLVGVGLVDKIINKILSKIFGTAYDGMKDDEMKDAKEKQYEFTINDLRSRLIDVEKDKLHPSESLNINNTSEDNFIKPPIPESMQRLALLAEQSKGLKNTEYAQENQVEDVLYEVVPSDSTADDIKNESYLNSQETALTDEYKPMSVEPKTEVIDESTPETLMPAAQNNDEIEPEIFEPSISNGNEYKPAMAESIAQDINDCKPETVMPVLANADEYMPKAVEPQNIVNSEAISNVKPNEFPKEYFPINNDVVKLSQTPERAKIKRDNYTYIPSSENVLGKDNPVIQVKKYIPSQTGIKVNRTFDNSALEAAIRRSYRAEQRALKVLAEDFDNL